jgi:hypothetical protein
MRNAIKRVSSHARVHSLVDRGRGCTLYMYMLSGFRADDCVPHLCISRTVSVEEVRARGDRDILY